MLTLCMAGISMLTVVTHPVQVLPSCVKVMGSARQEQSNCTWFGKFYLNRADIVYGLETGSG